MDYSVSIALSIIYSRHWGEQLIQDYFFLPNHLSAFGLRWGHPGQQHGRRFPVRSSSERRLRCSDRVSSFFTIVIQQIHSFRASGVSPFHNSRRSLCELRIARKSLGTRCTVPELIVSVVIHSSVTKHSTPIHHKSSSHVPEVSSRGQT
jgi:hypothetical protein